MFGNLITSLPMLVCIFWSVLLWLDWRDQHSIAKLRLMIFCIAAALLYLGHYVYFNQDYELLPFTDTLYRTANLSVFPLYYLYIKQMTQPQWKRHWQVTLLIPAAVVGLTVGTLYIMMGKEDTLLYIDNQLYRHIWGGTPLMKAQSIVRYATKVIFAIQVPTILIMGGRSINKYDEMVENCYADTENRSMHTIKIILLLFMVVSIASFVANIVGRNFFNGSVSLLCIPSLTFSALLFMLCYAGHRQNFNIEDLMKESQTQTVTSPTEELEEESGETSQVIAQLKEDIENIMQRKQLYLQPDLRINDIARLLNTNRNYIYQVINVHMGMSFAEYINKQRIDYAVRLLKDDPSTSCTEIYVKAGFSSQASFFRNFKQYAGTTPKQFVKQLQRDYPEKQ